MQEKTEIIKEIEYVEEHVEQVAEYLGGGDYEYQVNSYVTYMSEDVLSIAYEEYAYLEGDFFVSAELMLILPGFLDLVEEFFVAEEWPFPDFFGLLESEIVILVIRITLHK